MTSLSAVVETSLTEIRGIDAHIAKLKEEAKTARKAAIAPFLDALAASGEVSLIVIYGYTPGFNDGEPCEHSADFYVNIEQVKDESLFDNDLGLDEIAEWAGELKRAREWNRSSGYVDIPGAHEHNVELCRKNGHVYAQPSPKIRKAISDVVFAVAEEENSTNYYVTYILKDGKFEVINGDYDCGY